MPGPTYPVTLDTIGKLIDHNMLAFMYCLSCSRTSEIELEKLAERVGRDWYFIARRWPVKCADCGTSKVETQIRPGERITEPGGSTRQACGGKVICGSLPEERIAA